ncbi:hypothetical protein LLG95_09080 [bacterium]|nr:hypothetical protein [bacterium]
MKNTPAKPLFTMSGSEPRHKRIIMKVFMLVLALLAFFAAFQLLPLGKTGFSDSRAAKNMAKAEKLAANDPAGAAVIYERVAGSDEINRDLRVKASRQLVHLYQGPLKNAALAKAAQDRMEAILVTAPKPAAARSATQPTTATTVAKPSPVLVRIGDEDVTLDQVIYAWSQFNPNRPFKKGDPEVESFCHHYFDMVLMANEARRRGLDKQGQLALDLQLNRLVALNKAMTIELINKLQPPSEKTLIDFAQKTWGGEGDAAIDLGLIIVDERAKASTVKDRLKQGEDFGKIAGELSDVAGELADGYKLGEVSVKDDEIRFLGKRPGLTLRLAQYADGTTTGPLRLQDGYALLKILGHKAGRITTIKGIEDQVLAAYQRNQLLLIQQQELNQLRKQYPIKVMDLDQVTSKPK